MRIVQGIWADQRLISPGGRVRPTHEHVRNAWLSLLAPELSGARVLDLFAGSGALGLEALSRGAASADFVENSGQALHALKANIAQRKLRPPRRGQRPTQAHKSARVFKRDAIPFAARLDVGAYDIVFADPPYGSLKLDRIIERWMQVPFAPLLGVEHTPDHVVPDGVDRLEFEGSAVTIYRVTPEQLDVSR